MVPTWSEKPIRMKKRVFGGGQIKTRAIITPKLSTVGTDTQPIGNPYPNHPKDRNEMTQYSIAILCVFCICLGFYGARAGLPVDLMCVSPTAAEIMEDE